ncbi:WG repeat protein [Ruminiclostridium sufflavum DSM 19573]|uniref:WG repeat protein n=1 Tax=Ruminiclostridium sufflavum DSM 19573 TaxID=1121337 RepID=A0A318XPS8_9FIRM|nr:WG repeat-containing protein [Ruminiclostridium sufflavum]PYG87765.1 WG repeat protein [Ruminiclostridium sufflavum DSM 19573]
MMKKVVAILLLSVMILSSFSIYTGAEGEALLPASVITADGEKWGYINHSGKFAISPAYNFAAEFNDKGIAIVRSSGKESYEYGDVCFINKTGKVTAGPFTAYIPEYKNGMAIVVTDKKSSVIVDEAGKIVLQSKYELGQYGENLVSFLDSSKKSYGFMDLKGKIVIPAKFLNAWAFSNGKAIVEVSSDKYYVIDKTGKVLETLKYYNPYETSEGLTSYYDSQSSSFGYKLLNGTVAIKPVFKSALAFKNGYAVASTPSGEYDQRFGIINKKGEFVVKPEYSSITYLGQDLYAVTKNFDLFSTYAAPKAIMNIKGEVLTDYKYYSISDFEGGYASVCDNSTTSLIDCNGNIADNLPTLKGIGQMSLTGDIIKAEIDSGLSYMNKSGEIIWQKDETIPLNNNISLKKIKYRRDYLTYIEYPQITGMEDSIAQEAANSKLKKLFIGGYEGSPVEVKSNTDDKAEYSEEYYEEVSISFSAEKNKDLLIIEKSGYLYPIGAVHGMPSKDYFYIDTKTGIFYQLKDLFKAGSKYAEKLESIVNNQFNLNQRAGKVSDMSYYLVDKAEVSNEQPFIIGKDSLRVYYLPYEIASYAAGFVEFEIPYGQLTDILDTKGAFWNSFDKKILSTKINLLSYDIDDNIVKSIENVIGSYEKNMIEAINSNNFSKVEGSLLKSSNLYNAQKKLVPYLFKKNTKEKLNKYEIYAIDYDYDNNQYRAYVFEEVAVKYSGKNYVNNKYSWCYSIKADSSGNYKLTDICKW